MVSSVPRHLLSLSFQKAALVKGKSGAHLQQESTAVVALEGVEMHDRGIAAHCSHSKRSQYSTSWLPSTQQDTPHHECTHTAQNETATDIGRGVKLAHS